MSVPEEPGAGPEVGQGDFPERASLRRLAAQPADVLIIGGGITGAGVARDAAMRGLRTVLVDKGDFGGGTSSRSSRLVHGGLRYLETGDLPLVFEANRERRVLLQIAPHLVRPLAFVFPLHHGDRVSLWRLAAGMWLYDLLAAFRNVRMHRLLGKRGVLEREPMLRERGLRGGAVYYDAQCDDARLTLATVRSAVHHGALVANYVAVDGLDRANDRIVGATIVDRLTGERAAIRAGAVVNAAGPWADGIRALEDPTLPPLMRPTKGVHIVVDRARLGHRGAVTFLSPLDGRVMFVLPWDDEHSYIGTTDTDTAESPDAVTVTDSDVVYLLRSANARFPGARLGIEDVRATWAGLRPLLTGQGPDASGRSREHLIEVSVGGMITVAGGKLTTYRAMAAEVVRRVVRELVLRDGKPRSGEAATGIEPLPGGEARDLAPFRDRGIDMGLLPESVDHILRLYGTESAAVYNLGADDRRLFRRLAAPHPAIEAQVIHAVRREMARTVEDVLVRRLHIFYERPDHGASAAHRVAELMGEELNWTADQVEQETRRFLDLLREAGIRAGP